MNIPLNYFIVVYVGKDDKTVNGKQREKEREREKT